MRAPIVTLVLSASIVLAALAAAAPQSRAQRRCITTLQRDGLGVAAAQGRRNVACLRAAAVGDARPLDACAGFDPDGRVTEAARKTRDDAARRCADEPADVAVPPPFELTVNEAAAMHAERLFTDLFGTDAAGIRPRSVDKAGAKCQLATLQGAQRLVATAQRGALGCLNRAVRNGGDDAAALAACFEPTPNLERATARLAKTVDRRCAAADLLPGVCAGASAGLGACVAARARCRACRMTATATALPADCDLADDGAANDSCTFLVSVSGTALDFVGGTSAPITDGVVSILELPGRMTTTGGNGSFGFGSIPEGSHVTFVLAHPSYHPIQTGTIFVGARGVERVTFQAVTHAVFDAFAALLDIVPDPARCQMVTTVTRVGKSIYDPGAHGEDHVTVRLDPPLPADQGPIYFNSAVLPDRSLFETSDDGGVLFIQVPEGDYVWTAFKPARVFTRVRMACRAGLLVNASPPWGLQAH